MAKKEVKASAPENTRLEETIIHNLVELQKVHANLAEKFDKLSSNITQLLQLFELSARAFGKQAGPGVVSDKDREFLDKIDRLLEQNKTIAKGLMLMEEKMHDRVYGQTQTMPPMQPSSAQSTPRPLPRF